MRKQHLQFPLLNLVLIYYYFFSPNQFETKYRLVMKLKMFLLCLTFSCF